MFECAWWAECSYHDVTADVDTRLEAWITMVKGVVTTIVVISVPFLASLPHPAWMEQRSP
jgi:hypothetical protein